MVFSTSLISEATLASNSRVTCSTVCTRLRSSSLLVRSSLSISRLRVAASRNTAERAGNQSDLVAALGVRNFGVELALGHAVDHPVTSLSGWMLRRIRNRLKASTIRMPIAAAVSMLQMACVIIVS